MQRIFERENMANIVLFEVEVGGRTYIIGGFTTNGWVTKLQAEENNSMNGSYEESNQDHEKIQGRNGSFIFNLTENLRLDEVTSITMSDYYTKAFLVDMEKSVVTDDSQSSDSERSQQINEVRGELRFG